MSKTNLPRSTEATQDMEDTSSTTSSAGSSETAVARSVSTQYQTYHENRASLNLAGLSLEDREHTGSDASSDEAPSSAGATHGSSHESESQERTSPNEDEEAHASSSVSASDRVPRWVRHDGENLQNQSEGSNMRSASGDEPTLAELEDQLKTVIALEESREEYIAELKALLAEAQVRHQQLEKALAISRATRSQASPAGQGPGSSSEASRAQRR